MRRPRTVYVVSQLVFHESDRVIGIGGTMGAAKAIAKDFMASSNSEWKPSRKDDGVWHSDTGADLVIEQHDVRWPKRRRRLKQQG